jgi:hypothetical protein
MYTIQVAEREVTASPPEAVCDECGHAQARTVGGEIPADVTVTCAGHPFRRIGAKRTAAAGMRGSSPQRAPHRDREPSTG